MQFFQQRDLNKLNEALVDANTQLYNKTALYFLIKQVLLQYERYEENYSFIIMDCNLKNRVRSNYKRISQSTVDKIIADKLKLICRRSDALFYCGDGIFCILTRVFEGDDTVLFCKKITGNLKELEVGDCKIEVEPKYGITFSKTNDTPEEFSRRSYEALNKAKQSEEDIVINV